MAKRDYHRNRIIDSVQTDGFFIGEVSTFTVSVSAYKKMRKFSFPFTGLESESIKEAKRLIEEQEEDPEASWYTPAARVAREQKGRKPRGEQTENGRD